MSRNRIAVATTVVAIFVLIGGLLIFADAGSHRGHNLTFDVIVTGGTTMHPSSMPARQNDNVTINITSDNDGEVHLHVYDIHFDTKAGQTVSHTFKADKTCTCPIEWESTSTGLGQLVVSP